MELEYMSKGSGTNTGTNQGIINLTSLKTGAVGMYTKTSKHIE